MSSNTSNSNPINSPNNTSDTHSTNLNTPNDVRVVSQSQGEGENVVLSPSLQTPDNLHLLSTVCNDVLAGNSPIVAPASVAKEATPIIDSPTKLQIDVAVNKVLFASEHCENKRKATKKIDKVNKKMRGMIPDVSKYLLWYLRDEKVRECGSHLPNKILNTAPKYGPAYNDWRGKRHGTYAPFTSLKAKLNQSRCRLSRYHKRLLLEEFMVLPLGSEIICSKL